VKAAAYGANGPVTPTLLTLLVGLSMAAFSRIGMKAGSTQPLDYADL